MYFTTLWLLWYCRYKGSNFFFLSFFHNSSTTWYFHCCCTKTPQNVLQHVYLPSLNLSRMDLQKWIFGNFFPKVHFLHFLYSIFGTLLHYLNLLHYKPGKTKIFPNIPTTRFQSTTFLSPKLFSHWLAKLPPRHRVRTPEVGSSKVPALFFSHLKTSHLALSMWNFFKPTR